MAFSSTGNNPHACNCSYPRRVEPQLRSPRYLAILLGQLVPHHLRVRGVPMSVLATCRTILAEHQFQEIDGHVVDPSTAELLLKVHASLNEANAAKFLALPIGRMTDIAWRLVK